jgi:hypothetical protein
MDAKNEAILGAKGADYWGLLCPACQDRFNRTKKWELLIPGRLLKKLCAPCQNKIIEQAEKEAQKHGN